MSYLDLKINGKTQEHWRSQYAGFARERFGHPSNKKKTQRSFGHVNSGNSSLFKLAPILSHSGLSSEYNQGRFGCSSLQIRISTNIQGFEFN